jgi:hypothetical protein
VFIVPYLWQLSPCERLPGPPDLFGSKKRLEGNFVIGSRGGNSVRSAFKI